MWYVCLSSTGKFISLKSETLYFIFPLLYISVVLEPRITLEYIAWSYV